MRSKPQTNGMFTPHTPTPTTATETTVYPSSRTRPTDSRRADHQRMPKRGERGTSATGLVDACAWLAIPSLPVGKAARLRRRRLDAGEIGGARLRVQLPEQRIMAGAALEAADGAVGIVDVA